MSENNEQNPDVEKVQTTVNLQANVELRKGVFANYFTLSECKDCSVLDCFFLDYPVAQDDNGGIVLNGTMVSRLILSKKSLYDLQDIIERHLEKNPDER